MVASGYVIRTGTGNPSRSNARLDRCRRGKFVDLLAAEIDDLPVQCRQMRQQVAVPVKRQPVSGLLYRVLYRRLV